MNRRSFFGLFGGAAVVPFVKMPAVEAAPVAPVFKHVQYGMKVVTTGNNPKLLWPGLDALIYGDDVKRRKNALIARMWNDEYMNGGDA